MPRDDAWFERFYERHHRRIAAYCVRRIGRDDAADATAEVFAVAWRRSGDVPEGDRELPWLYGVARRVVSHQYRSTGRARRLALRAGSLRTVPPPGPATETLAHADHQLVRDAVMRLGEADREALLLSAWEGLTHAEIADTIGCSRAAVDKRIARAKVRLARQYEALSTMHTPTRTLDTRSPVRAPRGGGDR